MPASLTAHTGMDALTHAIEAYVSTLHTVFTDPLALEAIHIVAKDLLKSYHGDMACREEMHYGQCLAGMAFSNALLGIVHSMAHKTGAAFSTGHITHGLANAMYLPYVIAYNAKADGVAERYADIARTMGVVGDTTAELVEGLRAKIRSMNDAMGIPNTLKDFGILEDEFKEKLDAIAANAVGDACTGSNPRPIDPPTMAKLFTCIYYGQEVDWGAVHKNRAPLVFFSVFGPVPPPEQGDGGVVEHGKFLRRNGRQQGPVFPVEVLHLLRRQGRAHASAGPDAAVPALPGEGHPEIKHLLGLHGKPGPVIRRDGDGAPGLPAPRPGRVMTQDQRLTLPRHGILSRQPGHVQHRENPAGLEHPVEPGGQPGVVKVGEALAGGGRVEAAVGEAAVLGGGTAEIDLHPVPVRQGPGLPDLLRGRIYPGEAGALPVQGPGQHPRAGAQIQHLPAGTAQAPLRQGAEELRRVDVPPTGVVRRGAAPVKGPAVVDVG